MVSLKSQAVFNSLLIRVTSYSSFCSMYYSALSQLSQLCPNTAGMIKCQNNTNPSLILLLIQLYYIKDLSLLQADSEYDFLTFTRPIQEGFLPQNLSPIPCVTFHSSFSNSSHFLHIRHLLIKTKLATQGFMNKNLCSYDFLHNYLFRMLIPVPWFSLVLIYIWITALETNL